MHLFCWEQSLLQIWTRKIKKMEYFRIVLLIFGHVLSFCNFWESLQSTQHRFCLLRFFWSFIYTLKSQQEKLKGWKSRNLWSLLVLFKTNYGGVHPIFWTVFLVHIQEIGLCCKIPLGRWCIGLAGAAATTNLKKENHENWRFYPILFEGKCDGVLLIFYTMILILLQWHAKCFSAPDASSL